ncbi:fused MFS/spermidine synthase [Pseudarthrobacter sp. AL07]|uniref:spermidine synthase n=1 Tax=unclassified Pseudarthrobacter TaxID=2647000 RepID=UPI00249AF1BF|nr:MULTISPECIES: fused MFS/spermidine synthase [unclassified Pseudarthrobacter]MDI3194043.1 fused MFS/spermidine synthase [Pseudarthrobacter sp. AL20]MDI3207996.1 fused MFS/spermidine synthase [Pseudarthrobacter sp. AL07]
MAKRAKSGGRNSQRSTAGVIEVPKGSRPEGPVEGVYYVDTGDCELIADQDNSNGWLLKINGVMSSHIDLADPLFLDFEYMRWMAALIESRWPPKSGKGGAKAVAPTAGGTGKLRGLHLGGGACSLARYFHAAYPDARQVVVELDGKLAEYVRGWFDLPKAPLLRLRVGEAREVTETLTPDSRDFIIRDVFAGSLTPRPLTTAEFNDHIQRVLAPGGIYVVNSGDAPDLKNAREDAATIAAAFKYTVIVADPAMLKGRRYGNMVMAGSDSPLDGDPQLARRLLGGAVPAHIWNDAQVRAFAANSPVRHDPAVNASGD